MKSIYFVRHGSTIGGETKAYQSDDEPLSESGKRQASALAERFEGSIPIDTILSSDVSRALETAQIIGARLGHAVEPLPLLRELARPSDVRGRPNSHPDVLKVMTSVTEYWADRSKRHSDEENYFDLKDRALATLSYLSRRPESRVLVVTHGILMRMLFCCMMAGDCFGPDLFAWVNPFLTVSNTGVTYCEFKGVKWQLITWNDNAHLGNKFVEVNG